MALTVTIVRRTKTGRTRKSIATVAFDNSYPTGGEDLTPAKLGLNTLDIVQATPAGGYVFEYDHTNKKLKAFYGDNNNASDGPLIEVPNTTDLSAVTTRLTAEGL